jgi:hypothetical protein
MNVLPAEPMIAMFDRYSPRRASRMRAAAWSIALLLALGLFGRIMTFPLTHDEQMHIAAARLIFQAPLYGELGYDHLPGLPLLLGGFYAAMGSDHLLQTGRVLIFLCWIVTAIVMGLIARRDTGKTMVVVVSILLLFAGALLGPSGMLVTNNFLPIPFALLGVHSFLVAMENDDFKPGWMFVAGAAIGFAVTLKISYVFLLPPIAVAAVLVPRRTPLLLHLRKVLLPLLAGGLIGGLPVLVVLVSGPVGLYEHTVGYFLGGHRAFWQHSTDPKAMSVAAKMLLAEDVWLGSGGLLAALLAGVTGLLLARNDARRLLEWPIVMVAALVACGAIVAFAPTPAFEQYYEPPMPFVVLLFVLLFARLDPALRHRLWPLLATTTVLSLAIIGPRLLLGLPALAEPSHWTGNIMHAQGQRIRAALDAAKTNGRVATLSPIVALEGGLPLYHEFGSGPFVYRVAEYLPASDRRWFKTTSPRELGSFLDRDPPLAVIVGREPQLDGAFAAYARAHGYRLFDTGDAQTTVYLRPSPLGSNPSETRLSR